MFCWCAERLGEIFGEFHRYCEACELKLGTGRRKGVQRRYTESSPEKKAGFRVGVVLYRWRGL